MDTVVGAVVDAVVDAAVDAVVDAAVDAVVDAVVDAMVEMTVDAKGLEGELADEAMDVAAELVKVLELVVPDAAATPHISISDSKITCAIVYQHNIERRKQRNLKGRPCASWIIFTQRAATGDERY